MMDGLSSLLISCFSWTTLYFLLCLINPKRSYEWHIRSVTLIHALVACLLSAYGVFVIGPWPFTDAGGESSPFQNMVITMSLGYFLLDLTWSLYFGTEGLVMLFHHSVSVFGLSVCIIYRWWGIEMITTIFGAEITNPLLQLRWFLRETNNYKTVLGDVVDIAFMFTFGFFRILLGSFLLYSYYQQDTDFLGRLGGTAIYSIGWVFWISIVQYGMKKYRKRYGHSKVRAGDKERNGTAPSTSGNLQANGGSEGRSEVNGNLPKVEANGVLHQRKVNGSVANGQCDQNKSVIGQ